MKNIKKSKYLVVGNFILANNTYCEQSKGCCSCTKNAKLNEKNTKDTGSKSETTKEEKPKDDTALISKKNIVKSLYNEVLGLYTKLTEEQKGSFTNKTEFENINNENIDSKTDINELNNIENSLNTIKGNIEKIKNPVSEPGTGPKTDPKVVPIVDPKLAGFKAADEHKEAEPKAEAGPKPAGPKAADEHKEAESKEELKVADAKVDVLKVVESKAGSKVEIKAVEPKVAEPEVELKLDLKADPIIKKTKFENFNGINNLTVELKGGYLFFYSSRINIPFAQSASDFEEDFTIENIKKTEIKFANQFYSYKNNSGNNYIPVFGFADIDGFLKNIEENDSCVLKDIINDGKFIKFTVGKCYFFYDVINNYLFRLCDLKSKDGFKDIVGDEQHYFVVRNFPDFSYYFYNSNRKYGYAHLGNNKYELYNTEEKKNTVINDIHENPFLKESK